MKTILYTKDFNEEINEEVNVILSPHFYWVKKINVKIKNMLMAKKIAKNMFDLNEKEYIFDAYKIKEQYYAFAIKKNLDLKIPKKYIKGIYLAQIELFENECVSINKFVIKKIDEIFFCFPKKSDECKNFNELKIETLKHKINIDTINIDKSSLFVITLFFIVLNIFLLIQTYNYKNEIKNIENEKIKILKKYHLPKTTFQLDSIYSSLIDKFVKQRKIKKDLEFISNTPIKKFVLLNYENNKYTIEINTTKNLNNYFSKRFKIISYSLNPYKVVLEDE